MYNSGARLSEMTNLRRGQVRLEGTQSYVHILGKGRKERTVPLWPGTREALRSWLQERGGTAEDVSLSLGTKCCVERWSELHSSTDGSQSGQALQHCGRYPDTSCAKLLFY